MLLLHSLSDVSANNAGLYELFSARWGRENTIIWGISRHADFGPYPHTLSIRAAWNGTQHCHVNGRTIAVDDDNFLILKGGRTYATSIRAAHPVESLTICFRPDLVDLVHCEAQVALEDALDRRGVAPRALPDFIEGLQPHEGSVSPVLRYIRAHLRRGLVDDAWYEEQLVFLLERMRSHQTKLLKQIDRLALIRRSTRREAYRRISLATDFLHAHYARDVDLTTLAGMACLSKYHFLRLFTLIHGITPLSYLQRKRAAVAIRLLESTQMSISEVASSVGFAYESTLLRHVRRRTTLSPRQIRTRVFSGQRAGAFAIPAR
jgi:AraC family transcriptional regulator